MTTSLCQAPGPDGLRCARAPHADLWRGHSARIDTDHGAGFVVWWERPSEAVWIAPLDISAGLSALSAALHAIGDACRAGAR